MMAGGGSWDRGWVGQPQKRSQRGERSMLAWSPLHEGLLLPLSTKHVRSASQKRGATGLDGRAFAPGRARPISQERGQAIIVQDERGQAIYSPGWWSHLAPDHPDLDDLAEALERPGQRVVVDGRRQPADEHGAVLLLRAGGAGAAALWRERMANCQSSASRVPTKQKKGKRCNVVGGNKIKIKKLGRGHCHSPTKANKK